MAAAFPPASSLCVQGGADGRSRRCALDPRVRSVCFTGSVSGRARARSRHSAEDFSKDLALELGGSNALIVCADADLDRAAAAAADGACLTAGQRCNATSRIIVDRLRRRRIRSALSHRTRGISCPAILSPRTKLGPLISATAVARYEQLARHAPRGLAAARPKSSTGAVANAATMSSPAVVLSPGDNGRDDLETFVPIVSLFHFPRFSGSRAPAKRDAIRTYRVHLYPLAKRPFATWASGLEVGNLYANLPTTFSPSTLPFGGLRDSGNRTSRGRGFIRFTTDEQAVQWTGFDDESLTARPSDAPSDLACLW